MKPDLQTWIALSLVVMTASVFARRWWVNRQKPGCGGGCGCARKPVLKR